MDVTVAIGTFGDPQWWNLAEARAVPSAKALGVPVVHVHGATLHDARNQALSKVDTEWVVQLDADDELEPGYIDAMASGTAAVRAPSVRYVRGRHPAAARMPQVPGHTHQCGAGCLPAGNWLVIGSCARTDLVRCVGWRDFPLFEDWDLWLRCHLAGATFEAIPRAVYRAWVRSDSRNRAPGRAEKLAAHRAIAEANGVPVP